MTPEKFVATLQTVTAQSESDRLHILGQEEQAYSQVVAAKLKGLVALADAFNTIFLESLERVNTEIRPKIKATLPEIYAMFLPRLVNSFKILRAAQNVGFAGYPLQGYTLLRNVFDNNLLTSAALQNLTTFYAIEGIEPGKPVDPQALKKLRRATEFDVFALMVGQKSDLSERAQSDLRKLDSLFDLETHGSRLSLIQAMQWMQGRAPLKVMPSYDDKEFAIFLNRFCEVAWMTHRLLPFMQPKEVLFESIWLDRWKIVDDAFQTCVQALSAEFGKSIGDSFVEFISVKFPFTSATTFPE